MSASVETIVHIFAGVIVPIYCVAILLAGTETVSVVGY